MTSDPGALAAALSIAAAGIVLAWLFATGIYRLPARSYWDARLPWYARNAVFASSPIGVMFLFGAAIQTTALLPNVLQPAAVALLVAAAFGALLVGIAWMRRPPSFLKPTWLKVEEASRPAPGDATGTAGSYDRILVRIITVTIVVAVVFFLVAAVLGTVGVLATSST